MKLTWGSTHGNTHGNEEKNKTKEWEGHTYTKQNTENMKQR